MQTDSDVWGGACSPAFLTSFLVILLVMSTYHTLHSKGLRTHASIGLTGDLGHVEILEAWNNPQVILGARAPVPA